MHIKACFCIILFKLILCYLEEKKKAFFFQKQYFYQPPDVSLLKNKNLMSPSYQPLQMTKKKKPTKQFGIPYSASPLKWEASDKDIV